MGVGISLSSLAGAVAKAGGVGIISTAQIGFRELDFKENPLKANLRACLLYTSSKPQIPYVANVTAQYVTDAESVKPLLEKQVSSSVRWQQSVEMMIADGVDTFIAVSYTYLDVYKRQSYY